MTTLLLSQKRGKIAILFDLDGTLIDSLPDICGILNRVRESFGLTLLANDAIRVWVGKGIENLIQGALPELPEEDRAQAILRYRDTYLENPFAGGSLYPGVRATLELLKGCGVTLGVATNKSSTVADVTLAHYLPGFSFDVVAGPERVSRRKPQPEHLLEPLKQLGFSPEQAWFIGDDPVDLACATAARVRFLAASYGFGGVQAPLAQQLREFSDLLQKIPLPPATF